MTEDQLTARNLTAEDLQGKWWVIGLELPIGPYVSRKEAQAAIVGLQRYLRHRNKKGYVTTDDNKGEPSET